LREQEEAFEKYDPPDNEVAAGRKWWLTAAIECVRENRLKGDHRLPGEKDG
jgi:hypothetical protein